MFSHDSFENKRTVFGCLSSMYIIHFTVTHISSCNRWTFNPVVLRKASISETLPPLTLPPADPDVFSFKEGDFVKISSDRELVRKLQDGHGEWVDSMAQVRTHVC